MKSTVCLLFSTQKRVTNPVLLSAHEMQFCGVYDTPESAWNHVLRHDGHHMFNVWRTSFSYNDCPAELVTFGIKIGKEEYYETLLLWQDVPLHVDAKQTEATNE